MLNAQEVEQEPVSKFIAKEKHKQFIFAGNAYFTVRNSKTGNRFTFRVGKPKIQRIDKQEAHFVSVLTGPQNTDDYSFLGTIFNQSFYKYSIKSRVDEKAQSQKVWAWFFKNLVDGTLPDFIEVWHEGYCGRCGKLLTVPESIEAGFGPDCLGRI